MTPQEHLARAEQLLTQAEDASSTAVLGETMNTGILALVHIGLAMASELGVPHPQSLQEGATGGQ